MNQYPPELRTPPLPLVAFVGCPELHKSLGAFFSQTLRPPIVSIGVAEASESVLVRLFGSREPKGEGLPPTGGVLKAEWFLKHRLKRASVVLFLADRRTDIEGDPSSWRKFDSNLRLVRDAASLAQVPVILAIVDDRVGLELTTDKVTGICRTYGLDPRSIYPLSSSALTTPDARVQQEAELKPLGQLLLENACGYYQRRAEAIQGKYESLSQQPEGCPKEKEVQLAFKLAVMGEFRQDWSRAVDHYVRAYQQLKDLFLAETYLAPWRHSQLCQVGEQIHFKVTMLLLHQHRLEEAVQQFYSHMDLYAGVPEYFPPALRAAHLGWVTRQYLAMMDMIRTRADDPALATHYDCQPNYLHLAAVQVAMKRREAADEARHLATRRPHVTIDVSRVRKGPYLGQWVVKTEAGLRPLTDDEYLLFIENEELRVNHNQILLDLLNTTVVMFKDSHHERLVSELGAKMAREHMVGNNLTAARKLLLQVCHTLRRDCWELLLAPVVKQLKECAQRLKLPREFISFSLELSALPAAMDSTQQQQVATWALQALKTGVSPIKSSIIKTPPTTPPPSTTGEGQLASSSSSSPSAGEGQDAVVPCPLQVPSGSASTTSSFHYAVEHLDMHVAQQTAIQEVGEAGSRPTVFDLLVRHHQQDYGWGRCVPLAVGLTPGDEVTGSLAIYVAATSALTTSIPVDRVLVTLADAKGSWEEALMSGLPAPTPSTRNSRPVASQSTDAEEAHGPGSPSSPSTVRPGSCLEAVTCLSPGQWSHFHLHIQPRITGLLRLEKVVIHISRHASVSWLLPSFPVAVNQVLVVPGAVPPSSVGPHPFPPHLAVTPGVYQLQVPHVGPLPELQIRTAPAPLLRDEYTRVQFIVSAPGHLDGSELEIVCRMVGGTTSALSGRITGRIVEDLPGAVPRDCQLESQRHKVPKLLSGQRYSLSLWLCCHEVASLVIRGALLCPMAVVAQTEVAFCAVMEHTVHITQEPHSYVLALPPPQPQAPVLEDAATRLAIGQPVMVVSQFRVMAPVDLEVTGLEWEAPQGVQAGLQLFNDLSAQVLPGAMTSLREGSVCRVVMHLCPTLMTPAPISMGHLKVSWRRCQHTKLQKLPSQSWTSHTPGMAADELLEESPGPDGEGPEAPAGPLALEPDTEAVTWLSLPDVRVEEPLLSARTHHPVPITAGLPFQYTLQLQSFACEPQELMILLQDTHGMLQAGDRQQMYVLNPKDRANLTWTLVSKAEGQAPLPQLILTLPKHNCMLTTQPGSVYVLPF